MSSSSNYYASLLKLCCESQNQTQAKKLHCLILKTIKQPETFLSNNLITAYYKLGNLAYAHHVFDHIPQPNLFSWNTILSVYSKLGRLSQMQQIFNLMPFRDGVSWNLAISDLGRQINGQILKFGFGSDVFVGSPLVDMYTKLGLIYDAKRERFDFLDDHDYRANAEWVGERRHLICQRDAIGREKGNRFHAYVIRTDHKDNVFVGSALVDMYSKCRSIKSARNSIQENAPKECHSWTAMLVGYGQNGSVISSCANLASLEEGAQFHCRALVSGLISFITVSNALITLYGKCGSTENSHRLFTEMNIRDEVSWTALLAGYCPVWEKPMRRLNMVLCHFADHCTCIIDLLGRAGRVHGDMEIGKWAADSLIALEPQNPASYVLLSSLYASKGKWDQSGSVKKRNER
ncbi:putative pentatricopeptide repeat-containing protein [Vitis vinifera]|uniref:Putative pentatricopeptide repeat-containing protein n=1 Tax=Vitis vinifera TaxID=29760 RepID=A0A438CEA8_VITVI|nr:putative pentatricopeptide repeat-containing protein [Vitis vinifera]